MRRLISLLSLSVAATVLSAAVAQAGCTCYRQGGGVIGCAASITDCQLKGGYCVAGEPPCRVKGSKKVSTSVASTR